MRDAKFETTKQTLFRLARQPAREHQEEVAGHGIPALQRDPTAQLACRVGDASCAGAHAETLNRATVQPAPDTLLRLQRQYGNRFVQRVVNLSQQSEGEAGVAPEVEQTIQSARGGGQPLDNGARAQMEPAFGADFGGVRVHVDGQADTLNRSLSARALTTGQDIFFKQGEYSPGSSTGRELLAHELTHVVQQNGNAVQTKLTLGQPGDRYEQEADSVARAIVQQQGQSRDVNSILRLQRTIGNQAEQRLLEVNAVNTKGDAPTACSVPNGAGSGVRVAGTSVNAATCDEDTPVPEERESLEPCGDQMRAVMGISTHGQSRLNVSSVGDQFEQEADRVAKNECAASEGGQCNCPTCAEEALQAQNGPTPAPAPAPTFTFISRGSYGETTPGFTRPSCAAAAAGASTLVAGSATPVVTVFPNGTYRVRRNDGVVQTATCTRLAAGLAATQTHEDSHAAGARAAVAAANTAQVLPRNFATAAACSAAAPAILSAWNTSVDAAWANEVTHGPGTNQPTPQTFTEENAAGTCVFA
jgi:hypothetical protein